MVFFSRVFFHGFFRQGIQGIQGRIDAAGHKVGGLFRIEDSPKAPTPKQVTGS